MFLTRLIYYSRPVVKTSDGALKDTLAQILRAGLPQHSQHGLTGVLALDDDRFIHVIEGEREEVFSVFKRMFNDPRQDGVHLISFEEIGERAFEDWDVALADPDDETSPELRLQGYSAMTSDALLERARRLRARGINVQLNRPKSNDQRLWA